MFDKIIDCVGDETLFQKSPGYLKPKGKLLSIAGTGLMLSFKSKLPVMLGGTPRAFSHVNNSPSGAGAKEVAGWFTSGWIKEVPIDSRYNMDDVLKVSSSLI